MKKKEKEWKERKKKFEIDSLGSDGYRAKIIQPIINEIARLIDYGQPCIATGSYEGKMAGGHFISVGSNRSVSLNLHNIHIQSFHSNSWKGGDESRYRLGIINTYGMDYFEYIDGLRYLKGIDLSKARLMGLKDAISQIRNDLKRSPVKLSPESRIKEKEILATRKIQFKNFKLYSKRNVSGLFKKN